MNILLIILLWIIPGIVAIFITLKGLREERSEYNGGKLYNTVGDLGFATMIGLFGFIGLLSSILIVYNEVIIKTFNKKL